MNADRLGDDAWIVCGFFLFYEERGTMQAQGNQLCEWWKFTNGEEFFECLRQTYRLRRNVKWSIS